MRNGVNEVFVASVVVITLVACSDGDNITVVNSTLPSPGGHTEHTDIAEGIWPPEPLGMTNVQQVPASARKSVLGGVIDAARSSVLNNPRLKSALGADYREFEATLGDPKLDTAASFVFYNYATDESVVAELKADGEVAYETYPAVVFQPAEHNEEVEQAIALGADSLMLAGYETSGLSGTAMLAFPPASSSTEPPGRFYPQRMMYVTFGTGNGELPVYSALVNLGSKSVIESGVVR